MKRAIVVTAFLLAAACSNSGGDAPPADEDAGAEARTFGGARPVKVRVPAGYDPKKPAPLLLMLHGYQTAGSLIDIYIKMTSIADAHGFFYVAPDGTVDATQKRFWNATDACCNKYGATVDDVAYLHALVKEIQGAYSIDPKRIYVMGHSNGGFMTNRMACEHAETFAAGVSVAGAMWNDPAKCNPSEPVGFLEIHGDKDESVSYTGAPANPDAGQAAPYPSAETTVADWAAKNGCAAALVPGGPDLHLSSAGNGSETKVARHDGCTKNGAAELWTVKEGTHIFSFTPEGLEATWKFMEAHAKP